ncbi:MAG: autotransporter domain-containing protein, partial [Pseudomonadota bacterium]
GILQVGDAGHLAARIGGGVSVGAAGRLQGFGTIAGTVTNTSGGVVAPGGSTIGALRVGAYTQGAGSTLAIQVAPSVSSQLLSAGAVSLAGNLQIDYTSGAFTPRTYQIIGGSAVTGTFGTVNSSAVPANVMHTVYYTPTQVQLILLPKADAQLFGAVATMGLDQVHSLASMVSDRIGSANCFERDVQGTETVCGRTGIWGQGFANRGETRGTGALETFRTQGTGLVGGFDADVGENAALGAALSYSHASLDTVSRSAAAAADTYFGSVYGRAHLGMIRFDAQGFYARSGIATSRIVTGAGIAASDYNADTLGGSLRISAMLLDGAVLPYVRVSYAKFDTVAATETGAGVLSLTLPSQATT